jgi:DNA-directed RNA polymerase specialized sigma24 family protein
MVNDGTLHVTSTPPETDALAGEGLLDFEAFFDREKARLFQALCLVTRNRSEAEELTQDAFLSVYERWDRVGAMDDPSGHLYRTAMNTFRSWHRRSALA